MAATLDNKTFSFASKLWGAIFKPKPAVYSAEDINLNLEIIRKSLEKLYSVVGGRLENTSKVYSIYDAGWNMNNGNTFIDLTVSGGQNLYYNGVEFVIPSASPSFTLDGNDPFVPVFLWLVAGKRQVVSSQKGDSTYFLYEDGLPTSENDSIASLTERDTVGGTPVVSTLEGADFIQYHSERLVLETDSSNITLAAGEEVICALAFFGLGSDNLIYDQPLHDLNSDKNVYETFFSFEGSQPTLSELVVANRTLIERKVEELSTKYISITDNAEIDGTKFGKVYPVVFDGTSNAVVGENTNINVFKANENTLYLRKGNNIYYNHTDNAPLVLDAIYRNSSFSGAKEEYNEIITIHITTENGSPNNKIRRFQYQNSNRFIDFSGLGFSEITFSDEIVLVGRFTSNKKFQILASNPSMFIGADYLKKGWTDITFEGVNEWGSVVPSEPAQFRVLANGEVELRGLVQPNTGNNPSNLIATLPNVARPKRTVWFNIMNNEADHYAIRINDDGEIHLFSSIANTSSPISHATAKQYSLDGFEFDTIA